MCERSKVSHISNIQLTELQILQEAHLGEGVCVCMKERLKIFHVSIIPSTELQILQEAQKAHGGGAYAKLIGR